ncbi:NmrA family transcriptional regulator [Actinoplanes philippinensis]|uniref:Uncharacterized conserved protein YbjT, contains NAD(P)-binding and DUF2867 domains n=1 Tax=Actinoplanes philippinensis TaxID=35752 RepID=A0A1I2KD11_9ACTN|nr:NAD(P)H-binding protein [Actinoplanes philippinensis]GIE81858.1 NmrA family transcriptional regulator [Actinoplanes philippinensis]SFF64090.1 Uncharacterized conserved protein YbjT, contains NAD(P)-binding and DUF2867 domains [Actinoplanes philippinensis]
MIAVTGATGTIGRTLVKLLAPAGEEVLAVSRHAQHTPDLPGVRWAQGQVGDTAGLQSALHGARAVFVLLPGELTSHGEDPRKLIDVVAAAGLERIVFLSSQIAGTRPQSASHSRLHEYEQAVRASEIGFTILRPTGFASNALGWTASIRAQQTVYAPFGDVALPVVDPDDIAGVAAAALLEDGHEGRTYVLTGPQPISPREQTAAIGEAIGEDLHFVEVPREAAQAAMTQFMAPDMAAGSLDVLGSPLPAEQAVSPDVEEVLHRAPGSFANWAARNATAFR